MTESFPSKRAILVDVPEVTNFKADFVYNYFTPDEQLTQASLNFVSASMPQVFKTLSQKTTTDTASVGTSLLKHVPRYVKLTWDPKPSATDPVEAKELAKKYKVRDLYDRKIISYEAMFRTTDFEQLSFDNALLDNKLQFYVNQYLQNLLIKTPNALSADSSLLDLTRYINQNTSTTIPPDFISDYVGDVQRSGYVFTNQNSERTTTKIAEDTLNKIASNMTRMQIDKKFIFSIMQTTKENPLSLYGSQLESNDLFASAKATQTNAINTNPSTNISAEQYNLNLINVIDSKAIPNDDSTIESKASVIGYVIWKCIILPDGRINPVTPLFVEDPFANSIIDWNIIYGVKYMYIIQTIALYRFKTVNTSTSQIVLSTISISSQHLRSNTVVCNETKPPPGPADFDILWDYKLKKPTLTWSLPVNTQRDIKYFQIFRRKSIDEPYELLALYDFNDSLSPISINEPNIRGYNGFQTPELVKGNIDLVIKSDVPGTPVTKFVDSEFDRDTSSYIYTVCCVDAHGYSSNYGPQYQISFDKFGNRLAKKLISRSGAPKVYPNYFILQDLFQDSIKVSGAVKAKMYFNPETIYVYQKKKSKRDSDQKIKEYLSFLETDDRKGCYKLQMINIDLQQQQVYTARIKNLISNPPATNFLDPRLITEDDISSNNED